MSIVSKSSLLGVMLVAATAAGAQTTPAAQQPARPGASGTQADSAKMKKGAKGRKHAARGSMKGGMKHDSAAAKPSGTPK